MTSVDAGDEERGVAIGRRRGTPQPGNPSPRAIALSVLGLALVLIGCANLVGPSRLFTVDEGAAIVQARAVSEGSWTIPNPAPDIDPTGRWFPIQYSSLDGDGNGAPYAKHVLYPWLLSVADRVGGLPAMVGLSIVGTVGASCAAMWLARCITGRWSLVAFWLTGLGSPLLFDSFLIVAHTIAAAFVGAGTYLVLRRLGTANGRGWTGVVVVTFFALAAMLRNETVLYGAALFVATAALAGEVPRRRRLAAGLPALVGVGLAYVLDARLSTLVLDGEGLAPFSISASGNWIVGRVEAFVLSVLSPAFAEDAIPGAVIAVVIATVLMGMAAIATRHAATGGDQRAPGQLAAGAVVASALATALAPTMLVPGLLVAFPVLLWMIPWSGKLWARSARARIALATLALYAGAVVATQYSNGGGLQWGGRYFALAIPLAAAVLVAIGDEVQRSTERTLWRPVFVSVILVVGLVSGRSLAALAEVHSTNAAVMSAIVHEIDAISEDERPLVMTTDFVPPRLAWNHHVDHRWLLVPEEELELALERAVDAGEHEVMLLTPTSAEVQGPLPTAVEVQRSHVVTGGWLVQRLVLQPE